MMPKIILILLMLAFSVTTFAQVKTVETLPQPAPFSKSLQAIVVTSKDWDAVHGTAQLFERKTLKSQWRPVGKSFSIVVGKKGMAWSDDARMKAETEPHKVEGDGRSPAGMFNLTAAFGSGDKPGFIELPYTKLEEFTECVDDVKSSHYNKIVNRMQVGSYDWQSSEKMLAIGAPYELGIFVAHNSNPPAKGKGSCIFLHVWQSESTGTSGCTAMTRENIETVLKFIDDKKNPYLVQMPEIAYQRMQKQWKLPSLPSK